MLTIVKVALRHHQVNAALEQSTRAISNFLGPSPFLSLSDACKFGSIALLEWIWDASCTRAVDRTPGWSLTNFLRSDPHYHNWQFAKSLEAAASRGDVRMMEWIFAHFSGCEAPEAVAERAKENGYLRVLCCLMAHRSPPRGQSGDPFGQGEGTVRIRTTNLLSAAAIKKATENGQLVEYLSGGLPLEKYARGIAIKHALRLGDFHFAQQLLPSGGCLLDYAAGCPRVEMIEWMLDCGYLRRDEELAASTLPELARTGRLDLAQQVVLLHSPLRHASRNWSTLWVRALYEAGTCGHILMLQWLAEHHEGREALGELSKETSTRDLFSVAAERGHVETMDYLYNLGFACDFDNAMVAAVEGGQASSVKWLLSNHTYGVKSIKTMRVIDRGAEHGHLEVLKMFNELSSYECADAKRRRVGVSDSWWTIVVDPMYFAAKGGHLEVLKWFQVNRMQKCDTDTMDTAAMYGHLEVVKWLHLNRSEGCTRDAMNAHGHLEVVQWLYLNYSESTACSFAMYDAAAFGHLQIVKWLYENCPSPFSRKAIDRAVRSGHLRVASWLQQRFPEYRVGDDLESHKELVSVGGSWNSANALEVLLWLHSRDDYELRPWFLKALRDRLSDRWNDPDLMVHITNWLDEHYPDSP
ncbi:hypothetical protein PF010_g9352 [Phytophthora fragariae]|uniref:Ankyrin repeat-containing domain n=1 Tax=Phytophthora fragariae TaxID=53985 RepID=A0A6G0LBU7_9STRA|nr:hypothetical protein PF010_g9352 [Phytophthora fragariae]